MSDLYDKDTTSMNDSYLMEHFNLSEGDLEKARLLEGCPDHGESGELFMDALRFWVEGIIQTSIAISGVIFNIFSSIILASKVRLGGYVSYYFNGTCVCMFVLLILYLSAHISWQ